VPESNHLLLLKCRQFLPLLFLQHFHFKFLELGSSQVPQNSMLTVILVNSHSTVHTPVYDVTKLDLIIVKDDIVVDETRTVLLLTVDNVVTITRAQLTVLLECLINVVVHSVH